MINQEEAGEAGTTFLGYQRCVVPFARVTKKLKSCWDEIRIHQTEGQLDQMIRVHIALMLFGLFYNLRLALFSALADLLGTF